MLQQAPAHKAFNACCFQLGCASCTGTWASAVCWLQFGQSQVCRHSHTCSEIVLLYAGIHGSFTQEYLGASKTAQQQSYDIRNGVGSGSEPKYA